VDLAPLGEVTSAAQIPGGYTGTLAHMTLRFGTAALISGTPALTLYTSRHFLSADQSLAVIGAQFAITILMTLRPGRTIRGKRHIIR
jgi:hypothetical protein